MSRLLRIDYPGEIKKNQKVRQYAIFWASQRGWPIPSASSPVEYGSGRSEGMRVVKSDGFLKVY
jgi:hypothetical protein